MGQNDKVATRAGRCFFCMNSNFPSGTTKETSGDQTYRTAYTYDYANRMNSLTTFRSETETATTRWGYDPQRGFMIRKEYE